MESLKCDSLFYKQASISETQPLDFFNHHLCASKDGTQRKLKQRLQGQMNLLNKSKKGCKDQESIQSSTT